MRLFERIDFPDFLGTDSPQGNWIIGDSSLGACSPLNFLLLPYGQQLPFFFFQIVHRLIIGHYSSLMHIISPLFIWKKKKSSKYFPTSSKFHYIPIEILSSSLLSIFSLHSPSPLLRYHHNRISTRPIDCARCKPETRHRGEQRVQPAVLYIQVRSSRAASPFFNEFVNRSDKLVASKSRARLSQPPITRAIVAEPLVNGSG